MVAIYIYLKTQDVICLVLLFGCFDFFFSALNGV